MKKDGQFVLTAPNKLFPFETHGFKVGNVFFNTKGLGGPFLTYLPESFRQHIALTRVYPISRLHNMLKKNRLFIMYETFLGPSFDQAITNFPKIKKISGALYQIIDRLEDSFLKDLLTTILIICVKK